MNAFQGSPIAIVEVRPWPFPGFRKYGAPHHVLEAHPQINDPVRFQFKSGPAGDDLVGTHRHDFDRFN